MKKPGQINGTPDSRFDADNVASAHRWARPALVALISLTVVAGACSGNSAAKAAPPAPTTSSSTVVAAAATSVPPTTTTTTTATPTTVPAPPANTTTTSTPVAQPTAVAIAADESYVSQQLGDCLAFAPSCQGILSVVSTSDGAGSTLYAVMARQRTGDGCGGGGVWFFDNTNLVPIAPGLPPANAFSDLPSEGVAFVVGNVTVAGPQEFAVPFAVSTPDIPGGYVSCAADGNAGTATYIYRWTGTTIVYVSGQAPNHPEVIGLG